VCTRSMKLLIRRVTLKRSRDGLRISPSGWSPRRLVKINHLLPLECHFYTSPRRCEATRFYLHSGWVTLRAPATVGQAQNPGGGRKTCFTNRLVFGRPTRASLNLGRNRISPKS
jgi:hypothetical protein